MLVVLAAGALLGACDDDDAGPTSADGTDAPSATSFRDAVLGPLTWTNSAGVGQDDYHLYLGKVTALGGAVRVENTGTDAAVVTDVSLVGGDRMTLARVFIAPVHPTLSAPTFLGILDGYPEMLDQPPYAEAYAAKVFVGGEQVTAPADATIEAGTTSSVTIEWLPDPDASVASADGIELTYESGGHTYKMTITARVVTCIAAIDEPDCAEARGDAPGGDGFFGDLPIEGP